MGTVNFDVFFLGLSSESPIAHRESSIANRESTLSGRSLFDRANAHTKVCHSVLRSPEPSRTTFQGLSGKLTHRSRVTTDKRTFSPVLRKDPSEAERRRKKRASFDLGKDLSPEGSAGTVE